MTDKHQRVMSSCHRQNPEAPIVHDVFQPEASVSIKDQPAELERLYAPNILEEEPQREEE